MRSIGIAPQDRFLPVGLRYLSPIYWLSPLAGLPGKFLRNVQYSLANFADMYFVNQLLRGLYRAAWPQAVP